MAKDIVVLKGNENTLAERTEAFCRFVRLRENIKLRKEAGDPRPYSNDTILNTYHFCNVRRADDRVTKWIGEWSKKWPKDDRWFSFVVARWFNEPATLDSLPFKPWSEAAALRVLRSRDALGLKIFRPSYIITGALSGKGDNKYTTIVRRVLQPMWENQPTIDTRSIEANWILLLERPGMGPFMAGQIVADWATFGVISHPRDLYSWAPLGPGSGRGLRWIYQVEGDKKLKQDWAVERMVELYGKLERRTSLCSSLNLSLHDVQNCLCEFSKYTRGYSKTKYVPFEAQGTLL